MLSSRDSSNLRFQALTDLCAEINIRLNVIFANNSRKKEEKIKQDYNFFEPQQVEIQHETDHFNGENENISNKIKRGDFEEFVPKTAEEIEAETEADNTNFLETAVEFNKVDIKVSRNKEEKEVTDLFDQIKKDEGQIDPEIEDLFIDDNSLFGNDDITDEDNTDMELIDRTDFSSDRKIFDVTHDLKMDFVENEAVVKPEINEDIFEEKPHDETEEDILMDSIEIKNEFQNGENKQKNQVGETYPSEKKI